MIRAPTLQIPSEAPMHVHPVRVRFGDTDAAGVVYYANYLKYFEEARTELMRAYGLCYASLFDQGVVMPVVECWWRYRAPARYDDLLEVTAWAHEVRRASVLVGCKVHLDGALLGEGGVRLACTDAQGRPRRLPEPLRRLAGDAAPEGAP